MKEFRRLPYSLFQKHQERLYQSKQFCGAILMFHQVNDDSSEWDNVGCAISQSSFAKLADGIYPVVPTTQLQEMDDHGKKYFFTFDDAYDDVYQIALPILEKAGVPFTVFVAPGLLDKGKYLTQSHLVELSQNPLCTIGAHSLTHRMLRWLPSIEKKNEVSGSKQMLEDLLGKEIRLFAYPYGSIYACSKADICSVSQAGYDLAFSTLHCNLNDKTLKDSLFLPRINVCEGNYMTVLEEYAHD